MTTQILGEGDAVEVRGGGSDELPPQRMESLDDAISVEVPATAQQRAIHRAHCNLRHCSVQKLVRAMKLAGVRYGVRLWTLREFAATRVNREEEWLRDLQPLLGLISSTIRPRDQHSDRSGYNQHSDRSGYTPAQRVYGQLPTFPADMVSDSYDMMSHVLTKKCLH
eukprot:3903379-Amphidinium_carterae.1